MDRKRYAANRIYLSAIGYPVLLALLFSAMAAWSWRKWPDILVDFGRELYIPWQLAGGRVFHKEIAHLFGPFSAHLNALLFKVFGTSFTVVIFTNLVILAGMVALVYHFLQHICSRITAFAGCAVIILVFAFSQYVAVANYNFVSPYSHEATHGIVLSILVIHQLWRFSVQLNRTHLILAAFAFGCSFLTKVEIFAAICPAVAVFFVLMHRDASRRADLTWSMATFILVAFTPVLIACTYLGVQMPFEKAIGAVLSPYCLVFGSELPGMSFYREGMGTDNIIRNAGDMILQALMVLVVVASALLLSSGHKRNMDRLFPRVFCTIGLIGVIATALLIRPYSAGFSLPILTALSFVVLLITYLRSAAGDDRRKYHLLALVTWATFSLCLLGKILLNCILYHYGFYLSLPAAVLIVAMLVWFLPTWLSRRHSGGDTLQKVMVIMLAVVVSQYLFLGNQFYRWKNLSFGRGGDRMITYDAKIDSRGPVMRQAVSWLRSHLREDETMIAVPEGIILNYMAKKVNPSRYTSLMPPEMLAFGEKVMLNDLKANPPDYCLIVHSNPAGYGVRFLGQDSMYGKQIMNWIRRNYRSVHLIGDEPMKNDRFGIRILQHIGPG